MRISSPMVRRCAVIADWFDFSIESDGFDGLPAAKNSTGPFLRVGEMAFGHLECILYIAQPPLPPH
jgi:hypothetical protein